MDVRSRPIADIERPAAYVGEETRPGHLCAVAGSLTSAIVDRLAVSTLRSRSNRYRLPGRPFPAVATALLHGLQVGGVRQHKVISVDQCLGI